MTIYETPQHKRLFLFCFLKDIKIIFTDSNRAAETACGGASWALVILWVDDEDANHTFLKRKKIILNNLSAVCLLHYEVEQIKVCNLVS